MWTTNAQSYGISLKAFPRGAWNVLQYLLARQGPFASNVFESHAVLRSTAGLDRPDIQVVFQPARRNQNLFPLPLGHGFAISIVLLHPKSRGRLTLASANPRALPRIDPALLSAAEDIEPLVRGLKLARRVFAAPAFARYRATEFQPAFPPAATISSRLMCARRPRRCIIRRDRAAWVSTRRRWSRRS